jgi:hypothetical protein
MDGGVLFLCLQFHDSADSSESVSRTTKQRWPGVRGCLDRIQKRLNLAVAADMLKRRLKQGGVAGSLFAPLVPGDWDHAFFGK